jgi:hypothetical protein
VSAPVLWGFDLVVARVGDAGGTPVAVFPVAFEGADIPAAARVLQLARPRVPNLPAGHVVSGIRPHASNLLHLFGPGSPLARDGFEVLAGPAVHVAAARHRIAELAAR